nr:riboflavin biosynthesis protein RibF [Bacteroidota bacterium]
MVTTGSFDGVHLGHQVLIKRLNELAKSIGGQSVLITFYPHVRKVLYPDSKGKYLKMINSQQEKIGLLEKSGLDNLVIIPFTKEFAKTQAEEFVCGILSKKLGAKIIVVGYNHYFGHNREGNYDKLIALGQKLNFQVVEIPKQVLELETVGSTKIRESLQAGKIMHANAYLDHIYFITTPFYDGSKIYHDAGSKTHTVTIEDEDKLIPPDGIYAIHVEVDGFKVKGMMLNNYHGTYSQETLSNTIEITTFGKDINQGGKSGKVFVHKKVFDKIDLQGSARLRSQLLQAKKIIEELIY